MNYPATVSRQSQQLHEPLLHVEAGVDLDELFPEGFQDDDEEACGCAVLCEAQDHEFSWTEILILWIILPLLLFVQFGLAFYSDPEGCLGLRWSIVSLSIVLYTITAWLYRQACRDCQLSQSLVLLLPEVCMDVVLGLILFDRIVPAFFVLLFGMLFLALFVVVSSVRILLLPTTKRVVVE